MKILRAGTSALIVLAAAIGIFVFTGCGGSTSATQYTLDVSANVSITPTAGAGTSTTKLDTQTPQVMIGTMIVEVRQNDLHELGIGLFSMTLTPETAIDIDFEINLDPQTTTTGIIYKLDPYGVAYGLSSLNLDLQVSSTTTGVEFEESTDVTLRDGQTVVIGGLQAVAENDDRSRLPLLGDIPVINFLFQGQQHRAEVTDLLIVLTPQIIQDTE
jgi:type II secretory pathway component GspD/PulD (secretin)